MKHYLAIGTLLLSCNAFAQSSVTLYGIMSVGVEWVTDQFNK